MIVEGTGVLFGCIKGIFATKYSLLIVLIVLSEGLDCSVSFIGNDEVEKSLFIVFLEF